MDDESPISAICVHCGKQGLMDANMVQVGTSDFDRRWIHDSCWEEWYIKRLKTLDV